jgi:hypothetical protein
MTENIIWSMVKWLIIFIATLVAVISLATLVGLLDFGVQVGENNTHRAVTKSEVIIVLIVAVLTILVVLWTMYGQNKGLQ